MKKLYKTVEAYILSRTTFKVLLVVAMMLMAVPYIREKIGFTINLMLVYGYLIIGFELITGKLWSSFRTTKTAMFLGGFAVSYFITILINKTHLISGFKSLAFMVLLFVLCFLFPKNTKKDELIAEIKLISAEIVGFTFLFGLISFVMYVFSISGTYMTGEGTYQAYYGMFESRLWGIYNPNTSATLTIISIVFSFVFIFTNKKKRIRIPLIINIIIQFCVLLLTGSRAGVYVVAGAVAFFVFFAIVYKIKNFTYKTACLSISCAAVSLCIFFVVGALLREGLAYVPGLTNYITSSTEAIIEEITESEKETSENVQDKGEKIDKIDKVDLDRPQDPDAPENTAFANRLDIWQACFKEFLEDPIFGIGRDNVVDRAVGNLEDKKWSYHFKYGNTHNIYLCVLVSSGIIGFLLIGSFATITVSRSIKTVVKTYKKINIWFLAAFALCLMLFATEFVESRILYKIGIFGTVFWIYCEYMYKLSKTERIENSEQLAPKN